MITNRRFTMKQTLGILFVGLVFCISFPAMANPQSTTETVAVIGGGGDVGAATLVRTRNSATFRVNTTKLSLNYVYTIWIAAFNKPDDCTDDCDATDLAIADGSVYFGTAFVTGSAGVANVEFRTIANRLPEGTVVFAGHEHGIRRGNGLKVEIHLIISAHQMSANVVDWPAEVSTPGEGPPFEQVALFK